MIIGELLAEILLEESATPENIINALKTHKCATINYNSTDGKGEHTGERFIVPFAYGVTKKGNPVLRAFQPYGDSSSAVPRWKYFRLDRIENWNLTNVVFTQEQIESYKKFGEANYGGDETMSNVYMVTSFNGDDNVNTNEPSGVKRNSTPPSNSGPIDKPIDDIEKNSNTETQQSGPKYKVGDVIPYKELLRRSADFRKGVRKGQLTNTANDAFNNGDLKQSTDARQETNDNIEDTNFISATDQANDILSGIKSQLEKGRSTVRPTKIDLSQFDKFEPTTNKKRW